MKGSKEIIVVSVRNIGLYVIVTSFNLTKLGHTYTSCKGVWGSIFNRTHCGPIGRKAQEMGRQLSVSSEKVKTISLLMSTNLEGQRRGLRVILNNFWETCRLV